MNRSLVALSTFVSDIVRRHSVLPVKVMITMSPSHRAFLTAVIFSLTLTSLAQQDNGIVGDPIVDCADSFFEVRFETRNPFRGLVFVQDRLDDPRCRSAPAAPNGLQNASLQLAFKECGVERRTSQHK
ncbi:hypothetical protein Q1695_001196 [Nippostrongylus brasiliensis]|nr:hypothetical protein Q1695_001196 [Nippostrongylus brasiliensis]